MAADDPATGHPFTVSLNILLNGMHPPALKDGKAVEIPVRELAESIFQATGERVSTAYLHHLRIGRKTNPSLKVLHTLRSYFGLSSFDPLDDPKLAAVCAAELQLLNSLKQSSDDVVLELALRHGMEQGTIRQEALKTVADLYRRIVIEESE
jgi:hypothetical protein